MITFSNANGLAKISYGSSDYLILEAGSYVLCAVTGKKIPIDQLRYWNGDLQEAYIDAAASLQRWQETQGTSS
jgi:hypothetical protein